LRALQIDGYLKNVRENVIFISQLDLMATFITSGDYSLEAKQPVIADPLAFSTTHPEIFQARYIDETGMEIVRIEAMETGIKTVPEDQLQYKSDRYYFAVTMTLQQRDVYVSPVYLNRECDELQFPHTPTIRYATPVFRANGNRAGFVIINLYAAPFLSFFQNNPAGDAILSLVDQEGYYLSHPNEKLFS
jgi:hypothetical protein